MLTALRKQFGMTQAVFLSIVKKYKIVHFLAEQYELLHYYDNDYIINDIVKYIEEQGGNIFPDNYKLSGNSDYNSKVYEWITKNCISSFIMVPICHFL